MLRNDKMKDSSTNQLNSIVKYLDRKPTKEEREYIRLCLDIAFLDGRCSVHDELSKVKV